MSKAAILSTTGDIVVSALLPDLEAGVVESDTQVLAMNEPQRTFLASGVLVDITTPGAYSTLGSLTPGTVAVNQSVNSHLIHADRIGSVSTDVELVGSVTFTDPILGLIVTFNNLINSDGTIGNAPATTYSSGVLRDLELDGVQDTVTLEPDFRTVTVRLTVSTHVDNIRVVTAVPEPATAAILLLAVSGAVALRRPKLC